MNKIREIPANLITETVKKLFIEANIILEEDLLTAIKISCGSEKSDLGRDVLQKMLENAETARKNQLPLCQDTGLAIIFIEMGQDVHITKGLFNDAVQEGVRQAYQDGYLRKSVCNPLTRQNTGDNTPALVYVEIVAGDRIKITAMPKGGGSENMSSVTMLVPASGIDGIKKLVLEKVQTAGANPCPPLIVGVGIGGSIEMASIMAKKSLLRKIGLHNDEDTIADMERELLSAINDLGIGPQGYGGNTTALAVHVEMMPCHIASLPVAVNIQCHVARHKEALI